MGRIDTEDALKRLDKLTQGQALMAAAQVLKVANMVDDGVTGVDDKIASVIDDGIEAGVVTVYKTT